MDELVLGVILLGAALPVAVGLVYGLGLLLALVFIQILAQVQYPSPVVLSKGERHFFVKQALKNNANVCIRSSPLCIHT